jgi:hypothetical protein
MCQRVSLFLAMAAIAVSTVFTGCKKDDEDGGDTSVIADNKITATVSGVPNRVDSVYLTTENGSILARAGFENGGFTLVLPDSPPARYLNEGIDNNLLRGATFSDPSAKGFRISIEARNENGVYEGDFYLIKGEEEVYSEIVYADRDVTVTGTYNGSEYIETYNCHLKKGWNYVYDVYKGEDDKGNYLYDMVTSTPEGMTWHFDSYYH